MNMRFTVYRSADEIAAACRQALELEPTTQSYELPPPEMANWHSIELAAWPLGESIRLSIKGNQDLYQNRVIYSPIMEVVECLQLGRGRQSFVMALGFIRAAPLAARLAKFLNDPEINGHVIYSLLEMRSGGFVSTVQTLVHADAAWTGKLAKRYLRKYASLGKGPSPSGH